MKNHFVLITLGFALLSTLAVADHITTTSCTNSCVVTINSETQTVETKDCCGGIVTTRVDRHNEGAPGRNGN